MVRKHPVGSLLVWVTQTETADARGDQALQPGSVKLLLDGQQRITSLYGLIRGKAPEFFDGDEKLKPAVVNPDISSILSRGGASCCVARHVRLGTGGMFLTR